MKKKLVLLLIVAALGLGLIGYVSAEQMSFPERLAQRFNLNPDEVKTFLREDRAQMEEQKMNKMVENGRITEEQKEMILDKKEEMREEFEALKDLEPEENKERIRELKQEYKEWAEENEIPLGFLGRRGFHKGFGKGIRKLK